MTLGDIYAAHDAWRRVAGLTFPPQAAYRLLKYVKQVTAEYEVVEQQRVTLIRNIAGANDSEAVTLTSNTPAYTRFASEFHLVIEMDSDLKPFDLSLPALIDLLGKEQGNVLSVQDLSLLEPFFIEPMNPMRLELIR